jgi:hypothetical protein
MADQPKVVMVCSPPRSGTSLIAGMLFHLGVPMGVRRGRPLRINPKGCFEDHRLHGLRRKCMGTLYNGKVFNTFADRVRLFRRWYRNRCKNSPNATAIGGKLGELLLLIPEMHKALPQLHVICIDRPFLDHAKSHRCAFPRKDRTIEKMMARFQQAVDTRDAQIAKLNIPVLHLDFKATVTDPAAAVTSIIVFLGLTPTPAQLQAAIDHPDKSLVHHTDL